MNSPAKLSDTQLVVLSAAAQRADRCLVAPKNLKRGAAEKISAKLIEASFVRGIKAKPSMPVWRHDEEAKQTFSLKLTAAGMKAIAIAEDKSQPKESAGASPGEDASNLMGASSPAHV